MLLGDEHQLQPFGADRISGLASLFDVALAHTGIPKVLLSDTFRLPPIVSELIAAHVYAGAIVCRRNEAADSLFKVLPGELYPRHFTCLPHMPTSLCPTDSHGGSDPFHTNTAS